MGVGKNIKSGIDLLEDLLREVNKPAKAAVKAAPVAPTLLPAVPTVQAPAVMIPSRLNKLKETVRQSKGDYGARRVERAADEIPNLEALYNEQALRSAFKGDNAKALMTMNPRNFEHYARPLDDRFTDEFSTRHGRNGQQMSYREYMEDYLPNVGGFDDVPFLMISKEEVDFPLIPFITGHEGRHRNRVLANKGEGAGLVQLFSEGDLRTELPRKTQEEYIEALRKELGLTDNLVYPEKYAEPGESVFDDQIQRPAIKLPDIYAEGGEVHMGAGGTAKKGIELVETFLKELNKPAKAAAKEVPPVVPATDYRGSHTAPGPDFGAPLYDVSSGGMYPSDFYGPNGRQYYGNEGWDFDASTYNKILNAKNKPDAIVNIFRAIPRSVYNEAMKTEAPLQQMIRPGDWVTLSNDYAKSHGEKVLNNDYKVVRKRVPAKEVWTNADSIHEWGYHPDTPKAEGGEVHMMGGGRPPKKTTLEEDLKSFKDPAIALADLLAGLGRGTTAAATGIAGDLEELYRQFGKGAVANAVRLMLPKREGKATTFPTIEEMNAMLPPVVPAGAGRSSQVADVGQFFGENNPAAPTALVVAKPVLKAALPLAKKAGQAAKKAATSDDLAYALENLESNLGLGPKQIMMGKKSRTWNPVSAQAAEDLEKAGVSRGDVWREAGNYRGANQGEFRQEIPDLFMSYTPNNARQKQEEFLKKKIARAERMADPENRADFEEWRDKELQNAQLGVVGNVFDFIDHPELQAAYPDLFRRPFKQLSPDHPEWAGSSSTWGYYDPLKREIVINSTIPENKQRTTALHELQHAIQDIEGWQGGSSPEFMAAKMVEREEAKQRLKRVQDRIDYERAKDPVAFAESIAQDELSLRPIQSTLEQTKSLEGISNPYKAYKLASGEEEARMVERRSNYPSIEDLKLFSPYGDFDSDIKTHLTNFADGGSVMMADGGLTIEEFLRKQGY
jgi:hypothetical protein